MYVYKIAGLRLHFFIFGLFDHWILTGCIATVALLNVTWLSSSFPNGCWSFKIKQFLLGGSYSLQRCWLNTFVTRYRDLFPKTDYSDTSSTWLDCVWVPTVGLGLRLLRQAETQLLWFPGCSGAAGKQNSSSTSLTLSLSEINNFHHMLRQRNNTWDSLSL